jgi:hypothetical protein
MKIFSPILKGTTTVSQGTTNLSGSFTGSLFGTAATASYADNFTVGGTLTAQTINVQIITSSIEFNTGSTRNGALSTNTHEFTGSVFMSGSLNVGNTATFASSTAGYGITLNHTSENLRLKMGAIAGGIINIQGEVISNAANYPIVLNYLGGGVGIGASTSPTYKLEVSTAAGSERIRVGTLQNNNNSATFEAITSAALTTATSAFFRANAGGSATIGVATYTKSGGDSGNFSNLSNQANTVAIQITGGGSILIGTETDKAKLTIDAGGTSTSRPTISLKQGDTSFEYTNISGAGDPYHGLVLRGFPSVAGDYSVTAGDYMSFYEYGGQFIFYKKQPGVLTQQVRFSDGVIYATNTTVQSISDIRTKENITNSEQGLDVIDALRPVRFDFKEEFNEGRKNQLGFIAQEMEEIFPDAVGEWKDDNDGITYKTVGPGALIPVLVKAIQELKSENDTLKEILQRNNIQ